MLLLEPPCIWRNQTIWAGEEEEKDPTRIITSCGIVIDLEVDDLYFDIHNPKQYPHTCLFCGRPFISYIE